MQQGFRVYVPLFFEKKGLLMTVTNHKIEDTFY